MNIIVSGSTGYIGRNLIRFLIAHGHIVYALVRKVGSIWENSENVFEICCPMEKYSELTTQIQEKRIDVFYHFAWNGTSGSQRADYDIQLKNAKYTCDAAVAAKKIGCKRFIATGTITENVAKQILEKNYSAQNLIYGLTKLYTHNLLDVVCRNIGLEYVWAQLSNIYGGDNTSGNILSYTLNEWKNNRIPSFGPCENPYNFTHIDDVVDALYLIGSAENVETEYVISNGDVRKLKEFLEELSYMYMKLVNIGKRSDDGIIYDKTWFDNISLRELGFEPKYTFSEGIRILK